MHARWILRASARFPASWNPRLDGNQHITLVEASMARAARGGIVVPSSKPEVMTMATGQHPAVGEGGELAVAVIAGVRAPGGPFRIAAEELVDACAGARRKEG
jgi:hypothetical protein